MRPLLLSRVSGAADAQPSLAHSPRRGALATPAPSLTTIPKTELVPEGEERFFIGDEPREATRFLIKLEIARIDACRGLGDR